MKFNEVKIQLQSNENKLAKRTGWKTDKIIYKGSLGSISESDRQAEDWVVYERIDE